MSLTLSHSNTAPGNSSIMAVASLYWRAQTDFETAEDSESHMAAMARWDAAVALLATCVPATTSEAHEMQMIAIDCCRRDELQLDGGCVEAVLCRVQDALKLWSEQGAPLPGIPSK